MHDHNISGNTKRKIGVLEESSRAKRELCQSPGDQDVQRNVRAHLSRNYQS